MKRKRTHEDLVRYLTEACSYCDGHGYHKSKRTVCFEIFREIEKEAIQDNKNIVVFANSQVIGRMQREDKEHVKLLEERFKKPISIKIDPAFHVEQFEGFGRQQSPRKYRSVARQKFAGRPINSAFLAELHRLRADNL